MAIAFILRTLGKQDHPTGGCLIHVLPVGISVVAGIFVSFLCEAPWELGAVCGFVYPFWLIPDAARRRKKSAIRKVGLDDRPRMTHDEFVREWRAGHLTVSVNRGFALEHMATTADRHRYDIFMFLGRFFLYAALPLAVGALLLRIASGLTAIAVGGLTFAVAYACLGYANTQIARPACARALDRFADDEKLFLSAMSRNAIVFENDS